MESLIQILKNLKPDVDFDENTELIKNKIFDSLGMISLVAELSDEFDVEINEGGTYTVSVTGKKAKGSINFTIVTNQ